MKCITRRGLSCDSLVNALPRAYRDLLPSRLPGDDITLLLFPHDREDVVLSRAVRSALDDLRDGGQAIVAVAGCFTTEAAQLLRAKHATILQLSSYEWTDESYLQTRESWFIPPRRLPRPPAQATIGPIASLAPLPG